VRKRSPDGIRPFDCRTVNGELGCAAVGVEASVVVATAAGVRPPARASTPTATLLRSRRRGRWLEMFMAADYTNTTKSIKFHKFRPNGSFLQPRTARVGWVGAERERPAGARHVDDARRGRFAQQRQQRLRDRNDAEQPCPGVAWPSVDGLEHGWPGSVGVVGAECHLFAGLVFGALHFEFHADSPVGVAAENHPVTGFV
jgi:hypothetical protein